MRHRKAGSKLNRTSSHRKAMFRNMVTSLFKYDRITTTDTKAKELRSWADRLITLAKRGDLHARRQALSIVREKAVVHKLFEEAPKRFAAVSGGYTRVIKVGPRPGDAAMMSIIELVTPEAPKKKAKKKKTAAPKKAAAKKAAAKKAAGKKAAGKKAAAKKAAGKKAAAKKTAAKKKADEAPAEDTAVDTDAAAAPEAAKTKKKAAKADSVKKADADTPAEAEPEADDDKDK